MAIDKLKLFEETRAYWPSVVELCGTDAKERRCSLKRALYEIWRPLDDNPPQDNEWSKLAVWAYHQATWSLANNLASDDEGEIYLRAITFAAFDHWMLTNLRGHASWAPELAEYLSSPSPPDGST